ncbi:MAG TPA: right-handed parallel beta-helix repeat-containing protein [Pyrinomonadaceae bacterium]
MKACAFLVFALACTSAAHAQASRTWVSGVGDDANPCSRTAPCKTFAGAISKTADNGEIDALDPAGFGAVTITKGMTIDGGAGQVAGIVSSPNSGIIINETSNTKAVTLRNLDINGLGSGASGIRVLTARDVHIENVTVFGYTQHGIDISWAGAGNISVSVRNVSIHDCGQNAINMANTGSGQILASVSNSKLSRCTNGVSTGTHSRLLLSFTEVTHNTNIGLNNAAADSIVNLESVQINYSQSGIVSSGGSDRIVRIARCLITQNATGLSISGGGLVQSAGNNFIFGNNTDGAPTSTPGQS